MASLIQPWIFKVQRKRAAHSNQDAAMTTEGNVLDKKLQFDPSYLTGIDAIDAEHQRLVDLVGKAFDSLTSTDSVTTSALVRLAVNDVIERTAVHFANEESVMTAAGYPDLDRHRRIHVDLFNQTRVIELRLEVGEPYAPLELHEFLYRWLIKHIATEDKKFGEFMATQQ
jgi:hemerythrin